MTQRPVTPGTSPEPHRSTRRTLLAAAIGGAAVAVPGHWRRPLIDSVILPAHAQTSIETPSVAFSICPPETIPDGGSISFTLSETSCSTGADGVAFLTAQCDAGVTTLTIAPGVLWGYVSGTPAANPISVASGSSAAVTIVVENLVTGRFYRMEFSVSDDGSACTISAIQVFGPFTTAAEA